jgi:hypothetical protein
MAMTSFGDFGFQRDLMTGFYQNGWTREPSDLHEECMAPILMYVMPNFLFLSVEGREWEKERVGGRRGGGKGERGGVRSGGKGEWGGRRGGGKSE